MNFEFGLSGDVKALLRKTEKEYFTSAHPKSNDPQKHMHRKWLHDVVMVFADKTHLSFSQAWQAIREGDFAQTRPTHLRLKRKTPEKIKTLNGPIDNPLYLELDKIENMQIPDYVDWMRRSFDFATSIQHPLRKIGGRGASEPDRIIEARIAERIIRHQDETRKAHMERMRAALQMALDGGADRLLQRVRDTLGEESMSMKVRKEPVNA